MRVSTQEQRLSEHTQRDPMKRWCEANGVQQARPPSSGGDLGLSVDIEAGMPIQSVHSLAHAVDIRRRSERSAHVELAQPAQLPGRDFVLRYRTAGKAMKAEQGHCPAYLTQPPGRDKHAVHGFRAAHRLVELARPAAVTAAE